MSDDTDEKKSSSFFGQNPIITGILAGVGWAGGSFLIKKLLDRGKDEFEYDFEDD